MKESLYFQSNFLKTIRNSLENTLNFENHTEFTPYEYTSDTEEIKSTYSLCEFKNYILTVVIPHLKNHSKMIEFSYEEQKRYAGNPMKLSYDQYGSTDYWWIVMAINGYFNPSEFQNFKTLIIPEKEEIANIIDKESFSNTQLGLI